VRCFIAKIYSIDEIKSISVPVALKYGDKKLALFGSYAHGEQNATSDINFIIEKGSIQDLFVFCTQTLQKAVTFWRRNCFCPYPADAI